MAPVREGRIKELVSASWGATEVHKGFLRRVFA
jgi:hypothetical protein